MSQLFAAAERLRAVRRATRRFTMLWVMERDLLTRVEHGMRRDLLAPASATSSSSHDAATARRCSLDVEREGAD